MKTLLLLTIAIATAAVMQSCALPPTEGANPLDRPQDSKTARELHAENMEAITSNPGYRLP